MIKSSDLKKIVLILTGVMLISFAIALILFVLTGGIRGYSFNGNAKEIKKEETLNIENINNILINAVSEDVAIISTDEVEAKVIFYRNISEDYEDFGPELIINQNKTDLKINIKHGKKLHFTFFDFQSKSYLEFYLPKNYSKNISIGTVSGDILMDEAKITNANYKSVSGNIKISDIYSSYIKVSTTSGDTEIYGRSEIFDFKSVSGSFSSSELLTKASNLKTTSGDISIKGFKGNVTGSTVSGKIKINYLEFDNNITMKSTSGDVKLVLPDDAEFILNFRSTSGNYDSDFPVTIKKANKKHSIDGFVKSEKNEIKVATVSGNLEIKN